MGNKVIIDDGLKTYDIENKEGKLLGQFSFNPSDVKILERYSEVEEAIGKFHLNITEEMNEKLLEKAYKEAEDFLSEKINYLLGAEVAQNFFSIMGAFSPLASGQFFFESVLDAIAYAIQEETGERVKKINSKIKKHTAKYNG